MPGAASAARRRSSRGPSAEEAVGTVALIHRRRRVRKKRRMHPVSIGPCIPAILESDECWTREAGIDQRAPCEKMRVVRGWIGHQCE